MAKQSGNRFSYLLRLCLLVLPVIICLPVTLLAQDSTKAAYLRKQQPDSRKDTTELYVKRDSVKPVAPTIHSPRKAAFYSAVLPGLGQAYNRQYWKIPLVYAALGITTGTFIINMDNYRTFRNAYRIRLDGNADTVDDYVGLYSDNGLKFLRDAYREYVDYSVLVFVLAYGLNIVDATVFAHLKDFNMSDDLSMKIVPTVINNQALGLSLRFSIGGKKKYNNQIALGNKW
ncbi:DUF5683 domain-containing protein [Chitinophaga sp. S165]|uniref:DUF5683 domain-containing protein n=1 Tax=Chitinophaga sp. S165 TaxID=2135462 RepID=UPI000D70A9C6|nr:DUF5683 domain-containing protein [Chitinophaga sp. S165]PWV49548.1 hypothetical protein C7475_10555 [Chitinophaga sp. S165]